MCVCVGGGGGGGFYPGPLDQYRPALDSLSYRMGQHAVDKTDSREVNYLRMNFWF